MEGKQCAVCGTDGGNTCSGCHLVHYCSKEHQKAHWKDHKPNCKAYRIVSSESNSGQHLVASRDLKSGEIILQEDALLVSPKLADGPALCLGCCSNLHGRGVKCPNCKWPMCGRKECWSVGSHHELGECSLLKKAGRRVNGNFAQKGNREIYQSIMVLRCLSLRERDPSKFEKLLQLKYDEFSFRNKTLESVVSATVVNLIKEWMPDAVVPPELIVKLCCIVEENHYKLPLILQDRSKGLQAVYFLASMIGHSCIANTRNSFNKSGKIIVRAAIPIPKGTKICFNYVDPLLWTAKRQLELEQTKFGSCTCQRCVDTTELGTYVNGINCKMCPTQKGILLPVKPLKKETDWICNKCSDRKSDAFVANLLSLPSHDWVRLNRHSIPDCLSFIQKHSGLLHPNHFFLIDVKFALCHISPMYEECMPNSRDYPALARKPDPYLMRIETCALDLLKVIDVLTPGSNQLRGRVLFYLYDVLDSNTIRIPDEETTPEDLLSRYRMTYRVMSEACAILSLEPKDSKEAVLAKESIQDLKRIEQAIKIFEMEINNSK